MKWSFVENSVLMMGNCYFNLKKGSTIYSYCCTQWTMNSRCFLNCSILFIVKWQRNLSCLIKNQ